MKKPKFRKTVFDNGLTLVSESHPEFRSLSMGIWVRAGTRHEKPREAGACHFLEHMLFKGTRSRSALDIAREVDQVGGDFNAFTSREHTCFHLLLLARDLELGLDLLNDVVLNSTFDATELQRERKVILQEIAMVEESPEEVAHDFFYEEIFGENGLGQPILGTEKSIRSMKRSVLVDFFRHHYRPDQLVVSVAGDVDHDRLRKAFKALDRARPALRSDRPAPGAPMSARPAKPKMRPGKWWVSRPSEQAHVLWGVESPAYASRDRFAAFLLNTYLGGGMSSVLFQEIREKRGMAYTVYSSHSPYVDTGVFSVYAATQVGQVPLCLELIEKSVRAVARKKLSRKELAMVKENLKGGILLGADNVESRMMSIARNQLYFGKHFTVDEACALVDQVTSEDLCRVAAKLVSAGPASILVLGPKPSSARLKREGFALLKR